MPLLPLHRRLTSPRPPPPSYPSWVPVSKPLTLLFLSLFVSLFLALQWQNPEIIITKPSVSPRTTVSFRPAALLEPPTPPALESSLASSLDSSLASSLASSLDSSRSAARADTSQCGVVYADAMPVGTTFGGPLAPPFSPSTCPGIEGAIAGAVRAPATTPLSRRTFGDGLADPALLLPSNCSLRWLPPSEACALMPAMLVLVGDSLSRHLSFALRSVLTGNYAAGHLSGTVVPPDNPQHEQFFPPDFYPLCQCDHAYRICAHLYPPPTVPRFSSLCPSWGAADPGRHHLPPLHFLPWFGGFWNTTLLGELLTAPARGAAHAQGHPKPTLVLEVGPGWGEHYTLGNPVISDFLRAQFATAQAAGGARVVCYLTPAPHDPFKPPQFLANQGAAPTRALNDWVASQCLEQGGRVLDAFALTQGAFTRDGTHYQGQAMSVVAQALLNILAHFP